MGLNNRLTENIIATVLRQYHLPEIRAFFTDHKSGLNSLKEQTYDYKPIFFKTLMAEADACEDLRWVNKNEQLSNYVDKRKWYDYAWNHGRARNTATVTGYTMQQRSGMPVKEIVDPPK